MSAIRIFIVDDHHMIVEGIRSLLQNAQGIIWLGQATNAQSCLSFLQTQQPDVVLMDINLPDMSGIDLCHHVKSWYPDIEIQGLSSFNQLSFIQKMLENGASGYLLKNATREELITAINTVYEGDRYTSPEVAMTLDNSVSVKIPIITRREKEVLILIAEGMTNPEIANKLFISTTTVDTHRKNLLAKFEVKNTAALVKMAIDLHFL